MNTHTPLVLGQGAAFRKLIQQITAAASHDHPVLIVGEPGVGKTLAARAVHARSERREWPLVLVSCGAQSTPILSEQVFGCCDASGGPRSGCGSALERADRGSLLLRNAPELDPCLQSRLVRALAEEAGDANRLRPASTRLLVTCDGATTEAPARWRDLPLGHELEFEVILVPPLRERMEDLPLLVGHFVGQTSERMGLRPPEVLAEGLARLEVQSWPGNVRELENAVERAVILRRSRPLDGEAFTDPARSAGDGERIRRSRTFNLTQLERLAIRAALEASGGHQTRAARLLGISPRTLRRRLRDRTMTGDAPAIGRKPPAGVPRGRGRSSTPIESAVDPRDVTPAVQLGVGSGQRGLRAISSEGSAGARERARPDTALAMGTADPSGERTDPDDTR